jgi:ankyrin repeat and SAM domain-containing protein 1
VVDVLLKAGFPVSLSTRTGSALHEASLCGKVDVVRRLLEAGIDVSLKDANGRTALRIVQDLPTPVAQEIASLIQSTSQCVCVLSPAVCFIMHDYFRKARGRESPE